MRFSDLNEQISIENAKYLLALEECKLQDILKKDESDWNGETIYSNLDTYIKTLKKWLKKSINEMNSKGYISQKYKYSKDLVSCGRRYVSGFGIQKLTKELRGFLCNNYCVDLDMKNAHPVILVHLLKTYFPKNNFPILKQYVDNRIVFLKGANTTKHKVITSMYSNKIIKSDNQLYCKLDKEFKLIQKLFFEKMNITTLPDTIQAKKNILKQNKEGKFLAMLLNLFEDEIITKVEEHSSFNKNIQTIIFDGFHLDKKSFNTNTIKLLNEITIDYGIKWDVKEFDTSIVKDEGIDIDYEIVETYDNAKIKFEETHFIIENPFMFGRHYEINDEAQYQFYQKDKFKDLVKPFKYFDEDTGKHKEFFITWLEDPKRKSYKEVKFIPTLDTEDEIFNSFKGFLYEEDKEYIKDELHQEIMDVLMDHLNLLTNNDTESAEYLLKYICHLLQKPEELPRVSIILKSKQGFGKDTLLDLIERLISKKYILRTAEINDVFGSYNIGIRDKLVLVLNEMEGKDGFSNKDKIKNIGSEEDTTIREKYISQYRQTNYIRLFILSNNLNPIEISPDDRRLVVFKAYYKKPNKQYFDRLHAMIRNTEKMNILFNMLMNVDISCFDAPNQRPITEAYNNMKQHNINPLYNFLNDCFINNEIKDYFDEEEYKKKQKNFYVTSTFFNAGYVNYLAIKGLDYIKPNFKLIKTLLADIGIQKIKIRIGSAEPKDYYTIKSDEVKEQLSYMKLDEDIEQFMEEDFE
mgnify:FL=1